MSYQTKIHVSDYTQVHFTQSDKRYLKTGHARGKVVIEVVERAS